MAHATGRCDGRQEGRERGYYHLHRNLNDTLLHTLPPSLFGVAAFVITTAATCSARVDHEGRSLSGHREVTGIDTLTLGELNARAVQGCGRHLALSRRDADLHLVVLVEACTRGHGVAVLGH